MENDAPDTRLTLAPVEAEVAAEALMWPARARSLTVADEPTYRAAAELLLGVKALRAKIAETFDPHIKRAYETHKGLCREKSAAESPLAEAEAVLKSSMASYTVEQERARQAEETRLRTIAREDAERRQIEAAAALEREALATGDLMLHEEAVRVLEAPVALPTIVTEAATPKVMGITMRENWSARVDNLRALIGYVAAHPDHLNLLLPNQAALNELARALKGNLRIPGVTAVKTMAVAAGRR